jgi:hypothetical protein
MSWINGTRVMGNRAVMRKYSNLSLRFRGGYVCNLTVEPFQICFMGRIVVLDTPIFNVVKVIHSKVDVFTVLLKYTRP